MLAVTGIGRRFCWAIVSSPIATSPDILMTQKGIYAIGFFCSPLLLLTHCRSRPIPGGGGRNSDLCSWGCSLVKEGCCLPDETTLLASVLELAFLPCKLTLVFFSSHFLTEGIVAMSFAPAAVTRRRRSPANSSSNPAGSAKPATAACAPVAPALTSNWTNPLLPPQTEAPAWKESWEETKLSLSLEEDTPIPGGLKLVGSEELCTSSLEVQVTAQRGEDDG